jgi:hypothetical protein
VRAEQLSLDVMLYYPPGDETPVFKVHDKWLTKRKAIQELELLHTSTEFKVVCRIVKFLIRGVLDQVVNDGVRVDARHTQLNALGSLQKCDVERAYRNLLDYEQIQNSLSLKFSKIIGGVLLRWKSNFKWRVSTSLTMQLHQESTCSQLRKSLHSRQRESNLPHAE